MERLYNIINAIYREAGTRAMQRSVKLQSESKASRLTFGRGKRTVMLFGAGYSALHLAPHLQQMGYQIFATVRDGKKNMWLRRRGIEPIKFTGVMSSDLRAVMRRAQIIISSVPPMRGGGDPILASLPNNYKALAPQLKWAGYLSATSVYGDRGGNWAFEDELLTPSTARGRARVEAELAWLETGWPVHIFRLAGIYGPRLGSGQSKVTRNPLDRLKGGKARAVVKDGHITNRVHVDDIVSAVLASMQNPNPTRVYNIADGHPAPPQNVLAFGAKLLSLPPPPEVSVYDSSVSEMARSFYQDNKRIDISRAMTELNWTPQYSSYRHGLLALAQREHPKYVYLAGHVNVPEASLSRFCEALPEHIRLTHAETGCLRFEVIQDEKEKSKFHVFEIFKSTAAFEFHQRRGAQTNWAQASKDISRTYVSAGLPSSP